ncbi:HHR055Wp [Eremothecium sinecaudum]|uniref:HHR055Wp n=1 Tax=Eremothecium sinecaudum TaxID=45286 RepID=A0A0X8HWN9_9SACH|nr:HHR055Wp [Eremothecium sinecaudum]AMD22824.1 HHR055Wp [Eremothecium sinecaudum]
MNSGQQRQPNSRSSQKYQQQPKQPPTGVYKYLMTPNGATTQNTGNPHINFMPGQQRYMVPSPFGNMQFAAQKRHGSQTLLQQQQVLPQSQHQDPQHRKQQQQQSKAYSQAQTPIEPSQLQHQNYQGMSQVPQGQQFHPQGMSRRIPYSHYLSSYQVRKHLSNMALLRVHDVFNQINMSMGKVSDYEFWSKFTKDVFTSNGVVRYARKNGDDTRLFEFAMPIIPSLLKFIASTGLVRLELVPQQLRAQVLSKGSIFFECSRCTITYFYPDGSYMTNFSQIKGVFDTSLRVEWCDMCTYSFVPGIEWNSLERVLSDQKVSYQIFQALSDPNASSQSGPDVNRERAGNKQHINPGISNYNSTSGQLADETKGPTSGTKQDNPQACTNINAITLLRSQFKVFRNVSSFGIQESMMRVLQVNDVMSYLKSLKVYQKVNKIQSPLESLNSFVAASEAALAASQPMASPSVSLNDGTKKQVQNIANAQPPTPSTSNLAFAASVPYIYQNTKNQERKASKKRVSTDTLSPMTTDDSTKSPLDIVNGDNIGHPYKKMKF